MKKILLILLITLASVEAKNLYDKKCKSCHGATGEKVAMKVSKVINTFTKDELITALRGYKAGTYGAKKAKVMKSKVKKLSLEEITKLAEYIAAFKD